MARETIKALTPREQARQKLSIWFGSRDNIYHPLIESIANGIDEDAYRRFVLYYAAVEDNVMLDDSERLEYNLSRIIEDGYRKLNDQKHFPTEKAFQALAYINPCGAMASACRWDDRDDENIFAFNQTIPNIVFILLDYKLLLLFHKIIIQDKFFKLLYRWLAF